VPLTDDDIKKLVDALKTEGHVCRFSDIDPSDLRHSVEFFKNVNEAMNDTRNIIRKTLIVLFIGGLVSLVSFGVWEKIKHLKGGP
jgi:hypothetical protein